MIRVVFILASLHVGWSIVQLEGDQQLQAVVGALLFAVSLYLGLRVLQWQRLQRYTYMGVALLAVVAGYLFVRSTLQWVGLAVGLYVAIAGLFRGQDPEFGSLKGQQAYNRLMDIMAANKWYNFVVGSALSIFAVWQLFG